MRLTQFGGKHFLPLFLSTAVCLFLAVCVTAIGDTLERERELCSVLERRLGALQAENASLERDIERMKSELGHLASLSISRYGEKPGAELVCAASECGMKARVARKNADAGNAVYILDAYGTADQLAKLVKGIVSPESPFFIDSCIYRKNGLYAHEVQLVCEYAEGGTPR